MIGASSGRPKDVDIRWLLGSDLLSTSGQFRARHSGIGTYAIYNKAGALVAKAWKVTKRSRHYSTSIQVAGITHISYLKLIDAMDEVLGGKE